MVSEYTGAKQAVEKVDKKFVVPLDKRIISEKIIEYFDYDLKKKKTLSKKNKEAAKEFSEKDMLDLFKKRFSKFVDKIK